MSSLTWRIFRVRCFMSIAWQAREMSDEDRAALEELLTGDWDGRGLAGERGRRFLNLRDEFEDGWLHASDVKVWDHRAPPG